MNRRFSISAVVTAVSLLAVTSSTAEAARASKPKEIVVVGSKLMETHADHFAREAFHALIVWAPRTEFFRDIGRDDLAEAASTRVSERLRHKARAATAHVGRVKVHSLEQLARHGGTEEDVQAIHRAAIVAKRRILHVARHVIVILNGL